MGRDSMKAMDRRSFVKASAATAAAAGMFALAGCSSNGGSSSSSAASSTQQAASASASTHQVTDTQGNTVTVPTEINRIVDLWHAHNQIVFMLGAKEKLVGTTDNFKAMKWANVVYPGLADVESLVTGSGTSQSVNYEEALKLNPDIVFVTDKNMGTESANHGMTVANVMFQDFEGLRDDVDVTAQILGADAQKAADEWTKELDDNIDYVSQKMSAVSGDKVKVLHIVSKAALTKVDGTNCIVDEWIKLAGGVNAIQQDGNMIDVTMEDIVAADPDVIIIGLNGANDAVSAILSDASWSGITAVKNRAVCANPQGVFAWDRYSGEEALQVLWAAKKLDPEVFSDLDMVAKTRDFYKKYYGFDLTEDQANLILDAKDPQ